jgi:hypothetical protein
VKLFIPEALGSGFLPDEWYGTFAPGTEVSFNVDNRFAVEGFKVGDYQRGYML